MKAKRGYFLPFQNSCLSVGTTNDFTYMLSSHITHGFKVNSTRGNRERE